MEAAVCDQLPVSYGSLAVSLVLLPVSLFFFYVLLSSMKKEGGKPKPKPKKPPPIDSEEMFETAAEKKEPFPSLVDPPTIRLSVVVPAYNEEERIPVMLDEALTFLKEEEEKRKLSYEIIVVDDGSYDETGEVVLKYVRKHGHERIRLLRLQQNAGKGGAVRMGMLRSRGELMLMADADAATRFSDIRKLEAAIRPDEKMAVVVGSRRKSEITTNRSFLRRFFSFGFNWYTKIVGGVYGLEDTQCGFKLYTRDAARAAFPPMKLRRWAFDVESLYLAQSAGASLYSTDVHWCEIPGSKLSVVKATINMARDIFLMRFNYMTGRWKR